MDPWVKRAAPHLHGAMLYVLADQQGEVVELPEDARLVVHVDGWNVYFACFLWHSELVEEGAARVTYYERLFHGRGVGGDAKECRHTWWGDQGYVHLMPLDVVAAAAISLDDWFD